VWRTWPDLTPALPVQNSRRHRRSSGNDDDRRGSGQANVRHHYEGDYYAKIGKPLQRHLAIRNGKLVREFESLYDLLHIAGYYRGLLYHRKVVRESLDAAQCFVEKVA
jgi:hypothetical protein